MIKKISYFIKVAQCGNITKAANELFISQPSLSVAIKQLEKDWNVTLFERGCNSLSLSADGRRLLPYAESVMYDYHLLQQALSKKTNENLIIVGSGMTHVSNIVEDYNQHCCCHAKLRQFFDYFDLSKALQAGKCDLAVCSPPLSVRGIFSKELCVEQLCATINPNHSLAAADELTINDILNYPFITLPTKFPVRMAIDQAFYKANIKPNYTDEAENLVIHSMLVRGVKEYISIYPLSMARRLHSLYGLKYIPIAEDEFRRTIAVSWQGNYIPPKRITEIVQYIEQFYATSPLFKPWGEYSSDKGQMLV